MWLIIIVLSELALSFILKQIIPYNILELFLLIINFILFSFYLKRKVRDKTIFIILYTSLIIRIILVFVDIYIMKLPLSGNDTEIFHNQALKIANKLPHHAPYSPYGTYPEILGVLYYFLGPMRILIQFSNTILFILSSITVINILNIYNVRKKYIYNALIIYSFMLIGICESSALLRETLLIYLLSLSIYYLVIWMNNGSNKYMYISIIYSILSSNLHTGIITIILVYGFLFIFYDRENIKLVINKKVITKFTIFLLGIIALTIVFDSTFSYLEGITSLQDLFDKISRSEENVTAGSAYLSNLKINNMIQLIMFTPIKLIYFIISPMPWDFRGGLDIITFILDSLMYAVLLIPLIQVRKIKLYIPKNIQSMVFSLYGCFIIVATMYSWGVSAAGTAIRHRFKIFFILLISYTIYTEYRSRYFNKKVNQKIR